MKHSWYLLVLVGLYFIAQFAIYLKPPTQVAILPPAQAPYGPTRSWEWQLAKADFDDLQKQAEVAKQKREEEAKLAIQSAFEKAYCKNASVWTSPNGTEVGIQLASSRGWHEGEQWESLQALWGRESGWQGFVRRGDLWCVKFNYAGSGACGIPQALPCSKIPDPLSVESQIAWGLEYIARRYGDPVNAKQHWREKGWY